MNTIMSSMTIILMAIQVEIQIIWNIMDLLWQKMGYYCIWWDILLK